MTTISRWIPSSNPTRSLVIVKAFEMQNATAPANRFLTPTTATRLVTLKPLWVDANNKVDSEAALFSGATELKNATGKNLANHCSHFIQVFNFGVVRGKYPKAHRNYYGLDIENPTLPNMDSDDKLKAVAAKLIAGDSERMAQVGAVAMSNPTIAEVTALYDLFVTQDSAASLASQSLSLARKERDLMIPEADGVILKVYDETEANYNELPIETKRQNCREWGVIYIEQGAPTAVTALVKSLATGEAVAGREVKMVETGKKVVSDALGQAPFNTTVVGQARFSVDNDLGQEVETTFTIVEGVPMTVIILV